MDQPVIVLIAEDEAVLRDILKASFEDGGFMVLLVTSGEEAIAAIDENRNVLRALVTDIRLGSDVTGWEVARHGREVNPDLPVVYLTGSDADDWPSMGVPNSVLIPKPFAPMQVLTAVSQLMNVGNTPGIS